MKSIFALAMAIPFSAYAATATLSKQESLQLAQALILNDIKADQSKPVYSLEVRNLSCWVYDVAYSSSPNDPRWGMESFECESPKSTNAAAKLLIDTLDGLKTAGEVRTGVDCAMGGCTIRLKSIYCQIDSTILERNDRVACTLDDGK